MILLRKSLYSEKASIDKIIIDPVDRSILYLEKTTPKIAEDLVKKKTSRLKLITKSLKNILNKNNISTSSD